MLDCHTLYMHRALELARRGGRAVAPNPMVGAVLVHEEQVIGEGFHQKFGAAHAEVHAIQSVSASNLQLIPKSTLYVSLEPCSHFGKTPPCADLIIKARIPRVVVACRDPFAAVSGRGIEALRTAGIDVLEGVLREESILLNRRFITAHTERRPYIILKWAQTRDGFIAPQDRKSFWFSSDYSRRTTHAWRAEEMAILVGSTTATLDDPQLTVRYTDLCSPDLYPIQNPLRVVINQGNNLAPHLQVFNSKAPTLVYNAHTDSSSDNVTRKTLSFKSGNVCEQVCADLYQRGILSVLVEGGRATLQSFINAELWDEARVFHCPIEFGGGTPAPKLYALQSTIQNSGKDELHIHRRL